MTWSIKDSIISCYKGENFFFFLNLPNSKLYTNVLICKSIFKKLLLKKLIFLFVCFELLEKKEKAICLEEIKKGKAQNIGRSIYSCRPWACLWILVLSSLGSSSRSTSLLALLCSNKPKPTSHPHLHPKRDIREKERDRRRRRRRRRRRSGDNQRWIWTSGSRRWKTVSISSYLIHIVINQ